MSLMPAVWRGWRAGMVALAIGWIGCATPVPAPTASEIVIRDVTIYLPLDERPDVDRRSLFSRLAAAGVAVVPTLVVLERVGTPDDAALARQVAEAPRPAERQARR